MSHEIFKVSLNPPPCQTNKEQTNVYDENAVLLDSISLSTWCKGTYIHVCMKLINYWAANKLKELLYEGRNTKISIPQMQLNKLRTRKTNISK